MTDLEQLDFTELVEQQADFTAALLVETRLLRYDLRRMAGGSLSEAESREYDLFTRAADDCAASMAASFADTQAEIEAGLN